MTTNSSPLRTGGIAAARDYNDLPAWQKAIALAQRAYELSDSFAAAELKSELRAASARIATHIAAASGKPNEQGMLNSYFDAQAATAEFATLATIAERLGYLSEADAAELSDARDAVSRLLVGMRHGLKVEAKDEKRKEREEAERDREHAQRQERFDRKQKRDFGDKPRGERSDRDTGREERQYKPRGEYKPRAPREDGDRPYKPRGDKPYGDRKPRAEGEKREYKPRAPREDGERSYKPRGDKPYGDKPRGGKSFGDKPFKKGPRKDFRRD